MITLEMLENFKKYLALIETKLLNKYFEAQKDYIFCKEGCAGCCQVGEYPTSELELMYLVAGYQGLDKETQDIIAQNITDIKAKRADSGEKMYQCPFLINNRCSVYNNRTLICRTHGLLFYEKDKNGNFKNKMPACVNDGLNFSQVYDKESGVISPELWEKSGIKAEPVAYNISRNALMDNELTRDFGLEFGDSKAMIDWL